MTNDMTTLVGCNKSAGLRRGKVVSEGLLSRDENVSNEMVVVGINSEGRTKIKLE